MGKCGNKRGSTAIEVVNKVNQAKNKSVNFEKGKNYVTKKKF